MFWWKALRPTTGKISLAVNFNEISPPRLLSLSPYLFHFTFEPFSPFTISPTVTIKHPTYTIISTSIGVKSWNHVQPEMTRRFQLKHIKKHIKVSASKVFLVNKSRRPSVWRQLDILRNSRTFPIGFHSRRAWCFRSRSPGVEPVPSSTRRPHALF